MKIGQDLTKLSPERVSRFFETQCICMLGKIEKREREGERLYNDSRQLLMLVCHVHCHLSRMAVHHLHRHTILTMTTFVFSYSITVASLGWVTPGAATEGVTPQFFPEKPGDFFCSLPSLSLSLFIAFTRVSPPRECHPTHFLPIRPRFSTILCKFAHKTFFSFGCNPPP